MTHTGIFATSAECIAKLGNNYNSTNVDEDMINEFNADEGICLRCSGNGRVNLIRDLNFRLRAGI